MTSSSTSPLHLIKGPSGFLLCTPYTVLQIGASSPKKATTSKSDTTTWGTDEDDDDIFMASEEDIFGVGGEESSLKAEKNSNQATLVYKFKTAAVSFCHVGELLFSLHVKKFAFVEVTNIKDWTCVQSCLIKANLTEANSEKGLWIEALSGDNFKLKGEILSNDELALFIRANNQTLAWVASLDPGQLQSARQTQGQGLRKLKLHTVGSIERRHDVFRAFYKPRKRGRKRSGSKLNSRAALDRLFQKREIDVSEHDSTTFPPSEVKTVFPLESDYEGFLLLTRRGRLWQFLLSDKDGPEQPIERTLIPIKNCLLATVKDGLVCGFSSTGVLHNVTLPFVLPEGSCISAPGSENISRSDALAEISRTVSEVRSVGAVISAQEELLSQARIVNMLKAATCGLFEVSLTAHSEHSMSALSAWNISVKIKNETTHVFLGKYWSLRLEISRANEAASNKLTHSQMLPMPPKLPLSGTFVASFPLPKELLIGGPGIFPLSVSGDLIFRSEYHGQKAFYRHDVARCSVTTMNLMVFSSAEIASEIRTIYTTSHVQEKESDFDSFVKGLSFAASDCDTVESHSAKNLSVQMPLSVLEDFKEARHLGTLKEMAETGDRSTVCRGHLLGVSISFTLLSTDVEKKNCLFEISSSCARTTVAVKKCLEQYKLLSLQKSGGEKNVPVTKDVLARAIELDAEFANNMNSESGEDVALLEMYFRTLRGEVSLQL